MRTMNQLVLSTKRVVEPILTNKRTIDSMKIICQSRSLNDFENIKVNWINDVTSNNRNVNQSNFQVQMYFVQNMGNNFN